MIHPITRFIISALPQPKRRIAPIVWFGGKGLMVNKLMPLIPKGKVYVEPYGGAASILFNRDPVPIEVYNDLDEDLVNLFRTLQDPQHFEKLAHRLVWSLYARKEYERAILTLKNPGATTEERAWAIFVAQNQGIGGKVAHHLGSWGREITPDGSTSKCTRRWRIRLATLYWWHSRLTNVQIENRNALEVIERWDAPHTVFYVDPPYVQSTRTSGSYKHEADDEHHKALIKLLRKVKGAVVLSGYPNPIYGMLEKVGWECRTFNTFCFTAVVRKGKGEKRSPRVEVVWRNKRAIQMCKENEPGE